MIQGKLSLRARRAIRKSLRRGIRDRVYRVCECVGSAPESPSRNDRLTGCPHAILDAKQGSGCRDTRFAGLRTSQAVSERI